MNEYPPKRSSCLAISFSRILSFASSIVNQKTKTNTDMLTLDLAMQREYTEAMDIVPNLVQEEMPLWNFLRADDFNPSKASVWLALYWKYRK